jgi:SAM-dependent methyltransferase
MSDPYAADAEFYDLVNEGLGQEDTGLWLSFATRTDRPVLEVGCGTGRITLELARAGIEVTGVDPSPAMLAIARRHADEAALDVQLIEGHAQELALEPEEYGLALVPADVFLYCEDGEAQIALLRALAAALHFNGLLAIDLPGPVNGLDPDANGQPRLVFSGKTDTGALDAWQVHEDDLATQTRTLRVTYDLLGEDGLIRRRQSEHRLRYVYRFEAEYLLHLAGLALTDVYGDYDLGPFTNESERMILIARRADG